MLNSIVNPTSFKSENFEYSQVISSQPPSHQPNLVKVINLIPVNGGAMGSSMSMQKQLPAMPILKTITTTASAKSSSTPYPKVITLPTTSTCSNQAAKTTIDNKKPSVIRMTRVVESSSSSFLTATAASSNRLTLPIIQPKSSPPVTAVKQQQQRGGGATRPPIINLLQPILPKVVSIPTTQPAEPSIKPQQQKSKVFHNSQPNSNQSSSFLNGNGGFLELTCSSFSSTSSSFLEPQDTKQQLFEITPASSMSYTNLSSQLTASSSSSQAVSFDEFMQPVYCDVQTDLHKLNAFGDASGFSGSSVNVKAEPYQSYSQPVPIQHNTQQLISAMKTVDKPAQSQPPPPLKVKRPVNAFIMFSQHERRRMAETGESLEEYGYSLGEMSKRLGTKWRLMSKSDKQPFVREAARLRELFKTQQSPDYMQSQPPPALPPQPPPPPPIKRVSSLSARKRIRRDSVDTETTTTVSNSCGGDSSTKSSSSYSQPPYSPYSSAASSSNDAIGSSNDDFDDDEDRFSCSTHDLNDINFNVVEFDPANFENMMSQFEFASTATTTPSTAPAAQIVDTFELAAAANNTAASADGFNQVGDSSCVNNPVYVDYNQHQHIVNSISPSQSAPPSTLPATSSIFEKPKVQVKKRRKQPQELTRALGCDLIMMTLCELRLGKQTRSSGAAAEATAQEVKASAAAALQPAPIQIDLMDDLDIASDWISGAKSTSRSVKNEKATEVVETKPTTTTKTYDEQQRMRKLNMPPPPPPPPQPNPQPLSNFDINTSEFSPQDWELLETPALFTGSDLILN